MWKWIGDSRADVIGSIHIGTDSPFQKTPIITPKKWTVQPRVAFEDTAFKPGFEIGKL